jgi:hypothetical protein
VSLEVFPTQVTDLRTGDRVVIYGDVQVEVLRIEKAATGIRLTWRQHYAGGTFLDGRYLLGEHRVLGRVVVEEPEAPRIVDLMAALEASLAAVKRGRAPESPNLQSELASPPPGEGVAAPVTASTEDSASLPSTPPTRAESSEKPSATEVNSVAPVEGLPHSPKEAA